MTTNNVLYAVRVEVLRVTAGKSIEVVRSMDMVAANKDESGALFDAAATAIDTAMRASDGSA